MRAQGQLTIDDVGTPLAQVTFVVVDLETDGGSPGDAGITEFGAVKVRSGEVLGRFQSLVRIGAPLLPFISALTGISDAMLATAPPLASVLPAFLEFATGAVLVAHNAPYDVGFLKGACRQLNLAWPDPAVIDTAKLARNVVTRDEVPNYRLSSLAAHFRTAVTPNHRALADAEATVEVLHGLIGRVGNLGVHCLEDLQSFSNRVSPARRSKRGLADDLPDCPGVYIFEDSKGVALYVGTSKSIRRRVRTYFTATENRRRMTEMVALTERVVAVPCATQLEAQVRELRTIAARSPQYNRRSKYPQRAVWLKLTSERFPRLSIVTSVRDDQASGARYVGPFPSRRVAQDAADTVVEALSLRSCTQQLSARPKASACVLADLGRCPAPCVGRISPAGYSILVDSARQALSVDPGPIVAAIQQRYESLAQSQRYEDAAVWRDRLAALLRGIDEAAHNELLGRMAEVVAARPTDDLGWEVHVFRHGRLAGTGIVPARVNPASHLSAIVAAAEQVQPVPAPACAALPEETQLLRRWLYSPGVRLVDTGQDGLALPAAGAGRYRDLFNVEPRLPLPIPA